MLERQRARFMIAGPIDMIDVDFEFLDQRVEIARFDDDGNPQPLQLLDSWTAGAQPADEDFEAGSVQVLREDLHRFLRPADAELIADLKNSNLRHTAGIRRRRSSALGRISSLVHCRIIFHEALQRAPPWREPQTVFMQSCRRQDRIPRHARKTLRLRRRNRNTLATTLGFLHYRPV